MHSKARWLKLALQDPRGAFGRVSAEWDRRQDVKSWLRMGVEPRELYQASLDAEERLHRLLGKPWPCPEHAAAGRILERLGEETRGAGSVLNYFDADVSLSRVAWCVGRHLAPERVIETGVARGITSRYLLEALEANGRGTLWSIDLPHADTAGSGLGSAVPSSLRGRWNLILGPSSRYLPPLVQRLKEIDVFVHDSLHTARNVRFELEEVWQRIKPGGVVLVDDVNENLAFHSFVRAVGSKAWVVGQRLKGVGLWGAIVKESGN